MLSSSSLKRAKSANAAFFSQEKRSTQTHPIALIIGGTSGIGRGIAITLARHTNGSCRILIVGRNRAAGEAVVASLPPFTGDGDGHEFIACDVSLMSNIHSLTTSLLSRLPKLNYLFNCAGYISVRGYNPTSEGIDKVMALYYYSRFKFVYELLPLLHKAKGNGEDGKVMSVLNARGGSAFEPDNIGLKKKYSLAGAARQSMTYNDLIVEEFANRNPSILFIHAYPGIVRTALTGPILAPIINTIGYFFSVSEEQCGEYMLYAMTQSESGGFRTGEIGQGLGLSQYSSDEARKALWEHTVKETRCEVVQGSA